MRVREDQLMQSAERGFEQTAVSNSLLNGLDAEPTRDAVALAALEAEHARAAAALKALRNG
jgi:hypothetical protein